MEKRARIYGFTLIDLMITLSLLLFSLSIGIPSLTMMLKKSEAKALRHTITNTMQFARSYSLTTGKTTTVCGTNDSMECVKRDFRQLTVFIDANDNKVVDGMDEVLSVSQLNYNGSMWMTASLNRKYISFDYRGFSKQAGSFIYCKPQYPRVNSRVTISMPGRIYIARDSDNDGVVELADGNKIEC